ncbi:MAG: 1-acyl-sn-glycerol-3-phosphate acyltransferase, partial [Clostridia bacterium]|nr:1-acyl-sn-glycerol-3-phosphate acyltransferase [Clostridia bacterium]
MSEKSIFSEIEKPRRGPTLQEKLAARKYKTPSRFITFLYDHIASAVLLPKYNPHITVDPSAAELHTPCIIVWNHLSRLDHLYTMKAVYPRAYNMVAGYSEFFRSHLRAVFKLNQIIPKKIYEADIPGIRAMSSILKKGGIVTFSPEGMSSIYGTNQPVVPGSGRFIKFFGVHVYFLEERKGRTEARLSLLYTPEQLAEATGDEVEAKLNEIFRHDDYEWTRERHIKWNMHGRSCEHLDEICYR